MARPDDQETGWVFNIQRFSVHDGPGIRTTVFLKGCPLRCLWCDNPESQLAEPQMVRWPERCIRCDACLAVCERAAILVGDDGARRLLADRCNVCGACVENCYPGALEQIGRQMRIAEVLAVVEQDVPFYQESGGGITLSGGEPLAQPAFAAGVLAACRRRGLHTAIETAGLAPWPVWEALLPYVDLILYDLKEIDVARHRALTGVPNDLILANFARLAESGKPLAVRRPVIPGCNDSPESVHLLARFLVSLASDAPVNLLPYHRFGRGKYERMGRAYPMGDRPSLAEADVAGLAAILAAYGLTVSIGG